MTTFYLVEQCLNARSKTTASTDPADLDALTLNHFLLGTPCSTLPTHYHAEIDHRKWYVRAQVCSDAIWSRWLKEYVPNLNSTSKMVQLVQQRPQDRRSFMDNEPTAPRGGIKIR